MQFAESNWHSDSNPRATYELAVAEPARIQWTLGDAWRVALFGRHNDCGAVKCVGSCRDPDGKVPRRTVVPALGQGSANLAREDIRKPLRKKRCAPAFRSG